ncbi:MAG: hypothetical protein HGA24_10240, partial [Candidatus Aminicenantes bacterium]|nr:hypothetical protein [Candidatus Aminicenantes bacterium]
LQELRKEVEEQHRQGRLDESFYKELETKISFEVPLELPDAQTILVVSRPQPSLSVSVRWKGEDIPLTVPPGYADIEDMDTQALAALKTLVRTGRAGGDGGDVLVLTGSGLKTSALLEQAPIAIHRVPVDGLEAGIARLL